MWPKQREVAQKEACQTKDTRATGQQRKRNTCPPSRRDVNALHCACCSSFCCRSRLRSNTARQLPCRLVLACLITPPIAICTAAALDQTPPCRRLSASFWHVLAILACLVPFLAPCLHRSRFRSSTFSRLCGRLFFFGLHASHAPLPARFYIEIVVNVKNIVGFVDFEGFGDIVYQAGAGTWGIPAASPLRREG